MPEAVLLSRHGLHVELTVDAGHRVGRGHHAHVADVVLESAVTTIVDLEDSVATVDGPDKVGGYRSWLGLMTGELEATFPKGGETVTRTVNGDRTYTGVDGSEVVLPGRSLLLVRNVGHHMRLDAVRTAGGEPLLEECLDILVSTIAAVHDLRGLGRFSNSRTGSLYVVKPKMHGPDEVSLSVDLFTAVEQALELPPTTVKIGIMDEERRTSINLEACIARAAERVIFVNTGFLDRTGDEIHSDFEAGPVVRKDDEKSTIWLRAYEDRNVDVALRAGFAGHAQIGKGMWAQPAGMRAMLDTKGAQPKAGASTAWVPSPTAATLHALHYLETDVKAVQAELAARPLTDRRKLLVVPVLPDGGAGLTDDEKRHELETNAQSILGYVVRWVGLGIGCSTVPDLEGVGLMEDRATLRISSQEIANWLHHGLVDEAQVRETFARMAVLVDEQNAREPGYQPMSKDLENSPSFQAALELVFAGRQEPNGYTERALTHWRQKAKAGGGGTRRRRRAPARPVLDDDAPPQRRPAERRVLELRPATYDHPDAALLVAAVQREYVQRYGGSDATPVDPAEFAPPRGHFVVGYAAGEPVACGGWRARVRDGPGTAARPAPYRAQRHLPQRRVPCATGTPRSSACSWWRPTADAVTRGPCSPSWSGPPPRRAGGARCWKPARASPRRSRSTQARATCR